MIIARVDDVVVSPNGLWWPAMNYNQFRWDHPLGNYELELSHSAFVERLDAPYRKCVAELRADDLIDPEYESPLKFADYPSLEELPKHPMALLEAVQMYLYEDLFTAFFPCPDGSGSFMVNSIDSVAASKSSIFVRGRGYHCLSGVRGKG